MVAVSCYLWISPCKILQIFRHVSSCSGQGMEQPLKSCQSLCLQKEVAFMDWSVPGQYVQLGAEHKVPEMELCTLSCSLFAPFIKRWGVTFRLTCLPLNIWCLPKLVQSASCDLVSASSFLINAPPSGMNLRFLLWLFQLALVLTSSHYHPKDLQALLAVTSWCADH